MIVIEINPFDLGYEQSYGTSSLFLLHILIHITKSAHILHRYRQRDKSYNNPCFSVWRYGEFQSLPSFQLRIGDCTLIREGESLPADMLLLSTSAQNGTCHFDMRDTMGEGSLCSKSAVLPTFRVLQRTSNSPDYNLGRLQAVVKVESPNPDYCSFSGSIKLPSLPRAVPLKLDNFLLRGSVLKGEDWVIAMTVYMGMETKFWSNVQHSAQKTSFVERQLNVWVLSCCVVTVILTGVQLVVQHTQSQDRVTADDFLQYLFVYQNLVPLTLYIALDILRVIYALQCRDKDGHINISPCAVLGDLGRTQFILADKTGTITRGELELVAVYLGHQLYAKLPLFAATTKLGTEDDMSQFSRGSGFSREIVLSFEDLKRKITDDYDEEGRRFCECITLCNSIVIRKDGSMLATSTDEEALMKGAKYLGFELISRGRDECDIDFFDMCHSYQVLCVKKSSPEIKRMRILVQQEIDDFATLYIKGAYSVLKPMLNLREDERASLEARIRGMEERGLRIMILCYREFTGEYLAEVRQRAINAMSTTLNVDGKLEVLFQEIEQDLKFLGITGIVDHCPTEVKSAIRELSLAGVNTWLMSGDGEAHTLATAYQIGLIRPGTGIVALRNLRKSEDCQQKLSASINELLLSTQTEASGMDPMRFSILLQDRILQDNVYFALAIDGISLETALRQNETQRLMLSLMLTATTVCFSGLSPGQKRQIAKLIHQGMQSAPVVLSIGDNIIDMPMLLETNVSVALQGGTVQHICDISVPSFATIAQLILNEGRRSSYLISVAARIFLYSQSLLVMAIVSAMMTANYTPYYPIAVEAKTLYGAVFTFFPILYISVSSLKVKDAESDRLRKELTKKKTVFLTRRAVLHYGLLAIGHFALISACLYPASYNGQSTEISTEEQGFLLLFTCVCAVNIHCLFEIPRISVPLVLVICLSTGLTVIYYSSDSDGLSAIYVVFATPRLILGLLGVVFGCAGVSIAKRIICILWDRKGSKSGKQIYPIHGQDLEFRRIKKTASALLNVYSKHSLMPVAKESDFVISRKTAAFKLSQMETDYQRVFLSDNSRLLTSLLVVVLLQAVVPMIVEIARDGTTEKVDLAYKITAFAVVFGLLLISTLRNTILTSAWVFAIGCIITTFILNVVLHALSVLIYYYVIVYLLVFLRERVAVTIPISLLALVLMALSSALNLGTSDSGATLKEGLDVAGSILMLVLTSILATQFSYRKAIQRRERFSEMKQCEEKIAQSDSILAVLLPEFVRKQVKDGIRYIAEDKGQVSVIFIDICYFDQICAKYAPLELTALLDDIFQKIDEMCTSLHVAKIETVGKTYLACAGLRDYEFEQAGELVKIPHGRRCLDLAFAILSSFRSYKLQSDLSLAFKIGINTGEVIAGVVGFHKPQFSLVGDTVNTGSRMSTTLEKPNSVQISERTYMMVMDCEEFTFEKRTLEVKGKGEMNTYIVTQTPYSSERRSPYGSIEQEKESPQVRSSLVRGITRMQTTHFDFNDSTAHSDDLFERGKCSFCRLSPSEQSFRNFTCEKDLSFIRLGLILYTIALFTLFAARLSIEIVERRDSIISTLFFFALSTFGAVFVVFLRSFIHRPIYSWAILSLYGATSAIATVDTFVLSGIPQGFLEVFLGFLCLLMYHGSGLFFRHAICSSLFAIIPHIIVWSTDPGTEAEHSSFFILFAVQNCIFLYFSERNQRAYYTTSQLAAKEIEKTEQLLTQMLPVHAYESLKREQWTTDRLYDVTILYADISGFTAWSSKHTPQEVIGKLSRIFTEFDKICVRKLVYKVHTIGDCYVALSSTSNSEINNRPEECARMVSFALEMVSTVDRICEQDHEHLKMRIGIHVGEVTAGITGSGIVRYDIYGPDVLVANKMESNGREGRVNVSARAKAMLELRGRDEFVYEFNKTVEVKEIERATECFFVKSR